MEPTAPGYPPQPNPEEKEQAPPDYPPQQQQATYPMQQYPPQAAYPQQAYPQQAYPQQAYPQQAYPQAGYQPPQQPVLSSEAPPPYFPNQQQQATSNTVVVTSQPTPQVHTVYHQGNSEYGLPAIIFAVAITVCLLSLGCWWAIFCSAIGIALGVGASSSATHGDMETAKQYNGGSLACTVISLFSVFVPIFIFIMWIIIAAASA